MNSFDVGKDLIIFAHAIVIRHGTIGGNAMMRQIIKMLSIFENTFSSNCPQFYLWCPPTKKALAVFTVRAKFCGAS